MPWSLNLQAYAAMIQQLAPARLHAGARLQHCVVYFGSQITAIFTCKVPMHVYSFVLSAFMRVSVEGMPKAMRVSTKLPLLLSPQCSGSSAPQMTRTTQEQLFDSN